MTKPFESTYRNWQVRAAETGRVRICDPRTREAAVIELGTLPPAALQRKAQKIYDSLLTVGLLDTVKAYRAAPASEGVGSVRVASSIVDGAIDDMDGFDDHEMYSSATDERTTDMKEPRGGMPSAITDERLDDMVPGSVTKPPSSITEESIADHDRGGKPPTSTTDEEHPDNQEGRRDAPSSVLEGQMHDHTERVAARLVHKSAPHDPWRTATVTLTAQGRIASVVVQHPDHGARSLTAADLKHWAACEDEEGESHEAQLARTEQRLLAHFEAERAAMVEAHEKEKALHARAAVESFQRALRLVNRRLAVGLEPSPLRTAMETALAVARPVGVDAATQAPIVYSGLSPRLSQYLAAEAYGLGSHDQLEQMMSRAATLMEGGAQYLASAEADTSGFRASPISLTAAEVSAPDAVVLAAAEARGMAVRGNMTVSPVPVGGIDGTHGAAGPSQKHAAIGAAVANTRTAGLLSSLSGGLS